MGETNADSLAQIKHPPISAATMWLGSNYAGSFESREVRQWQTRWRRENFFWGNTDLVRQKKCPSINRTVSIVWFKDRAFNLDADSVWSSLCGLDVTGCFILAASGRNVQSTKHEQLKSAFLHSSVRRLRVREAFSPFPCFLFPPLLYEDTLAFVFFYPFFLKRTFQRRPMLFCCQLCARFSKGYDLRAEKNWRVCVPFKNISRSVVVDCSLGGLEITRSLQNRQEYINLDCHQE